MANPLCHLQQDRIFYVCPHIQLSTDENLISTLLHHLTQHSVSAGWCPVLLPYIRLPLLCSVSVVFLYLVSQCLEPSGLKQLLSLPKCLRHPLLLKSGQGPVLYFIMPDSVGTFFLIFHNFSMTLWGAFDQYMTFSKLIIHVFIFLCYICPKTTWKTF